MKPERPNGRIVGPATAYDRYISAARTASTVVTVATFCIA